MKMKVCWTGEGTYPYFTGGVSTWTDLLISNSKNIDFIVMPLQITPFDIVKFNLPKNVTELIGIPLWNNSESSETKNKIVSQNSVEKFIIIFINLLEHIYKIKDDMEELGENLYQFYEYFQKYNFYETFYDKKVWDVYKDFFDNYFKNESEDIATLFEMVDFLRHIFRFFIMLLPTVPYADIYHSSAAAFCGLPCIIGKKKYKSKFLLTEHGIYLREQYLSFSRTQTPYRTKEFLMGLITTVSKLNYYFSDKISTVCEYNSRWELQLGVDKSKIKTIYNGVDTDKYKQLDVEKNNRPIVVMVARIESLKDIKTFIYCADLVRKDIKNVLFKLYGPIVNEEYYQECNNLVKELALEDNFIFAGNTDSPELAYNEGDVVMLTSISEGFPFVVLEAMSCEKVIISSDVGGTKEVLEGFGYVVKPKDYKEFANKAIYVLKNKKIAKEMGNNARKRVLNGFKIEDMIENYKKLYRDLINEE